MTDYCLSNLSQRKHAFPCPNLGCKTEWPFFVVSHVANLTPHQRQEFETLIQDSETSKDPRNQRCPSCRTWCRRQDLNDNRVECPVCTAKQGGRRFLYCCDCLREWKALIASFTCGNLDCGGTNSRRLEILARCPEKMILKRLAPVVRGCPKCGTLLEYNNGCTQMCCTGCRHYFCFYCLQGANTKAELKCKPYEATCIIAPRQTALSSTGL